MLPIIIYGNKAMQDKIQTLIQATEIDVIRFQGLTTYQEERAFIYGNANYGHAVAVICITGDEPIPFGVLSADINTKKLPVVVYVANTDKARTAYADFSLFLEETNVQLKLHFKNCDSFQFKEANYSLIHEDSEASQLVKAIQTRHATYLEQPEKNRTVRGESVSPTEIQLEEKRQLFSKMEGFSHMASSLEQFKSHLVKNIPTVSFFGAVFPPLTTKCEWASHLGRCNLIFGLGGADKNKSLSQQSIMYQFVYHAKKHGGTIFGTIPYGQVRWEESRDFSQLEIQSCYITPQLQERMEAFKCLSDLVIVGSSGTGTYEEILDTLRTNPLAYLIIINDDGENTPLVQLLGKNKDKYPNSLVASTQEEFQFAVEQFKSDYQTLNKEKTVNQASFFNTLVNNTNGASNQTNDATRDFVI